MFVMFNLLLGGLSLLMLREDILESQYMFPQSLSFLEGLAQYLDFGIVHFGWLSDVHTLREVFICNEFFLLLSKELPWNSNFHVVSGIPCNKNKYFCFHFPKVG